jgi:hypothetical protein
MPPNLIAEIAVAVMIGNAMSLMAFFAFREIAKAQEMSGIPTWALWLFIAPAGFAGLVVYLAI